MQRIHANAMAWLTCRKYAPPHVCYYAKFGHSALNDVGINIGEPQKFGSPRTPLSWIGGMADPNIHAPPARITAPSLVVLRQRVLYV